MKPLKPRTRRTHDLKRLEKNNARQRGVDTNAAQENTAAMPADIDEFRNSLARRLTKIIGNRRRAWRDCAEPSCRRTRSCMAPHIKCSNAAPGKPDPDGQRMAHMMAQLRRAHEAQAANAQAEEIAPQVKRGSAGEKRGSAGET
jgi:hypothetical protein